jgi:hypothetical protein
MLLGKLANMYGMLRPMSMLSLWVCYNAYSQSSSQLVFMHDRYSMGLMSVDMQVWALPQIQA